MGTQLATKKRGRGRPREHHWQRWLEPGRSVTLERDRDYRCSDRSMAIQARCAASAMGLRVKVSVGLGSITVEVLR
jgi:hypothetical protein